MRVKIMVLLMQCIGAHLLPAAVPPPDVGITQNRGASLPLAARFRDDVDGLQRPLRDFISREHPTILVMGYFGCPQLCNVVMNRLVESLTELKQRAGRDFDVVFASIDPRESPALAAEKKRTYVRRYGKPETAAGWHFLTGESEAIHDLARSVGFRYVHDAELDQYAHGSGLMVVSPDGRISKYFYGIDYPPQALATALRDAAAHRIGGRAEELLLLCYHYNPLTGRYGMWIWRALQTGALLTLGGLGWFIVRNARRGREVAG